MNKIILLHPPIAGGWKNYQDQMIDLRNRYIAHLDLRNPLPVPEPKFDTALQVVYVFEEWVRQFVSLRPKPFSQEYTESEEEAYKIAASYPHP